MRPPESFIGQPIRSLQTMLRVIAEDDPRHTTLIPDGIYGPETMASVSAFQSIHGLPPTGITDSTTWDTIVTQYDSAEIRRLEAEPVQLIFDPGQVIRKGERHPHIYILQALLTVMGNVYESIPKPAVTGILDDATADALAAFQYLSQLPETGTLDKVTWKHISLHYPMAAALW